MYTLHATYRDGRELEISGINAIRFKDCEISGDELLHQDLSLYGVLHLTGPNRNYFVDCTHAIFLGIVKEK